MAIGDIDKDGRLSLKEYKSRYKLHQTLRRKILFFWRLCEQARAVISAFKLENFLAVRQGRL